jgi:hypothetical protein
MEEMNTKIKKYINIVKKMILKDVFSLLPINKWES